jgi:DNA-binding Xre family transcriptional regulator
MMAIKFRLGELIAERKRKTGEPTRYADIVQATGVSTNTLTKMAKNEMKMVGLDTIEKLTDFFGCDIGDLMVKQ